MKQNKEKVLARGYCVLRKDRFISFWEEDYNGLSYAERNARSYPNTRIVKVKVVEDGCD